MLDQSTAENLKTLIANSLTMMADRVPPDDANDVQDYVDHGEYGIAWELLWHFVGDAPPPPLVAAGRLMGFDVATSG